MPLVLRLDQMGPYEPVSRTSQTISLHWLTSSRDGIGVEQAEKPKVIGPRRITIRQGNFYSASGSPVQRTPTAYAMSLQLGFVISLMGLALGFASGLLFFTLRAPALFWLSVLLTPASL